MKIVRAEFQDLDDMCQTLRAWDVEFHPLGEIPSKEIVGNLIQVIDSDIKYGYSRFTPGLSMAGTPPEGLVTFNVMEPANRRYWVRGHDVDEGMVWVFPVGAELRSVSAPGFQVHTLSVAEEQIERVADELERRMAAKGTRHHDCGFSINQAIASWLVLKYELYGLILAESTSRHWAR